MVVSFLQGKQHKFIRVQYAVTIIVGFLHSHRHSRHTITQTVLDTYLKLHHEVSEYAEDIDGFGVVRVFAEIFDDLMELFRRVRL